MGQREMVLPQQRVKPIRGNIVCQVFEQNAEEKARD